MHTLNDVRRAANKIVAANPDATNPRDEANRCLYTRLPGRHEGAEHCLGGEVLLELGAALPPEYRVIDKTPDSTDFTESAMEWLRFLQAAADANYIKDRSWHSALKRTRSKWANRRNY